MDLIPHGATMKLCRSKISWFALLSLMPVSSDIALFAQKSHLANPPALSTFRDLKHGVSFDYPSNWKRNAADPGGYGGSSLLLNPNGGYDPATINVQWVFRTGLRDQPEAGFVSFTYAVLPERNISSCSKRVARHGAGENDEGLEPDHVTVNGIVFDHAKTEDAGLGHSWSQDIYTTFRNGKCYGFEAGDEARHVDGDYSSSAADDGAPKQLDAILRSVRIDTKSIDDTSRKANVAYTNHTYGFTFILPAAWRGFSVLATSGELVVQTFDDTSGSVQKGEGAPTTYRIITLRHPLWTKSHPRQDIPILLFTIAQWNAEESGQLRYSTAAPVGPDALGHNARYVFALPPRFTAADLDGVDEVLRIVDSRPLHAF